MHLLQGFVALFADASYRALRFVALRLQALQGVAGALAIVGQFLRGSR
jgi:hypothetical protein